MKVKELKELLNKFDDNLIVMIPNRYWEEVGQPYEVPVLSVAQGVNKFDGY